MTMSCNCCDVHFNFFRREYSCCNCELSFCKKCLRKKCKVPNKGPDDYPACMSCFMKLTNKDTDEEAVPPPDAFIKRVQALKNTTSTAATGQEKVKHVNISKDAQLHNRLEKLKGRKKTVPTEEELRQRLHTLKGKEYNTSNDEVTQMTQIPPVDFKTEAEQVESLLQTLTDANSSEITLECNNLEDSEEEIEKITRKVADEVALDEKTANILPKSRQSDPTLDEPESSSPELPWCVLCNKDAQYKCLDCNDLYCAQCNKYVHKTWGESDHHIEIYNKNN